MTITQLQYIVAVDTFRSFGTAAEKCFVTQPTLSMQIQKLEEEMGIKIFDRSKQPVVPTELGMEIIEQARIAIKEFEKINEIIFNAKGELRGEISLGVIPTLAPYLLPLFVVDFIKKYPHVHLKVSENTTEEVLFKLRNGLLDCGLVATPLHETGINEFPLFYENFVAYGNDKSSIAAKSVLKMTEIDLSEVWLLDEGNCMRSQVISLCKAKSKLGAGDNFHYETGSIETLKRMVELNAGITILPELAIHTFTEDELERVRFFEPPEPVREISLITHRYYVKKNIIEALKDAIIAAVPQKMILQEHKKIMDIKLNK